MRKSNRNQQNTCFWCWSN